MTNITCELTFERNRRTVRCYESDGNGGQFEIGFPLAFSRIKNLFRIFVTAENDMTGMPLGHFSEIREMRQKIAQLAVFGRHLQGLAGTEPLTPTEIARQRNLVAAVFSSAPSKAWEEFDRAIEFCRGACFDSMRRGVKKLKEVYLNSFRIPSQPGLYIGEHGTRVSKVKL